MEKMFQNSAILLLLLFTPTNYQSGTYNHSAHIDFYQKLPSTVAYDNGESNDVFQFDNDLNMTAHLYYDDEGNYRVDSFYFEFSTICYKLDLNQNPIYVNDSYVSYTPDWSFTQNQYAGELENVTFRLFIDDDSTYHTEVRYDGAGVVYSEESVAPTIYTNIDVQFTLNPRYFFEQIEDYVLLQNGVGENGQEYQRGYTDGFYDASQQNSTAVTIFSGIINIGLLPVNFFLAIMNFEVFGINIGGFVSGLLTIALILILIRFITQGGKLQ